ncbi:hypothetical protein DFP72DRAFT_928434 [Ephemerocybe angulata]|uniref:DUF6533 domain-containing protein n=1 Tax=Ephemerocybe angulata TaxID=980116 RepID=A0A8H6HE35_9AGAR|nr:hypothetical protein DFP72DRAFT_928434 [Tulosesus angulatus]
MRSLRSLPVYLLITFSGAGAPSATMASPPIPEHDLERVAYYLMAAKMYSLASCVMLFYDILLTFGREVESIWMKPRYTWITLLWALNRYLSPLGYIVIIVSFHQRWNDDVCNQYILFPEALKVVTSFVIGVIFLMRLYALYSANRAIMALGAALLVAEITIKIWAFTDGVALELPDQVLGCILIGKNHTRFAFTWIAELAFDTAMFVLTLGRTIIYYRLQHRKKVTLLHLIIRDGVIYFAIIFAANVVTVFMVFFAPEDIKVINASFSTLITSLMISRLVLNLRDAAEEYRLPATNRTSAYYRGESQIGMPGHTKTHSKSTRDVELTWH